jgi:hypothetical protein
VSIPAKTIPLLSTSDIARFWQKVKRSEDDTRCWLWTAAITRSGYGRFQLAHSTFAAHRIAFHLSNHSEEINGLMVCHSCDVRTCCNPNHLFLGTHQDNMDDKRAKHRVPSGTQHGRAKLTVADVQDIRRSTDSSVTLGKRLNVSSTLIQQIRKRNLWKHVS